MWDDLLGDLVGLLVGVPSGECDADWRRGRVSSKRRRVFESGREIRLRCALRWPDSEFRRWRMGTLRLSRGSARWSPRFRRSLGVELDYRKTTPRTMRRRGLWERFRLARTDVVLVYGLHDGRLELAIRRWELTEVARLFEMPPAR
ncbi:hypothetical protein GCM10017566_31460 [Amycolatopsis bartoniae]|uniref:Uncharacterized protein n=1 Tax=Amycolatopsis bartoniae TaxID=941986 RepID=A0A8H9J0J7_9PSEU|nr:hypothetical protein GCM10017566_31460 [Amycolatopsis bartoniae]